MASQLKTRQLIYIIVSEVLLIVVCKANNKVTTSTENEAYSYSCILDTKKVKCLNNSFCNNTYTTIHLDIPPYVDILTSTIFEECCGTCFVMKAEERTYRNILDIKVTSGFDFIYPVLGQLNSVKIDGLYFLPVVSHSGFYYVTQIRKSTFELAIDSCLQMYPMLFIFIFLSIIFGFIFWLLEAYQSESEYPKAFPIGWIKGTWWGMMSLVSQGPESPPRSVFSRLLAFLWIFVAVILVAIVTSIITATMVKTYPIPSMEGKTIVTLSNRTYNEYIILKNYGRAHIHPTNDTTSEIWKVLELGLSEGYGGALIDQYVLRVYITGLRRSNIESYKLLTNRIHLTTVQLKEEKYYGLAVAEKQIYEYFKNVFHSYIIDSEIQVLRYRNNLQVDPDKTIQNKISKLTDPVLFDIKQTFVQDGLIYCAIIIASLLLIGAIYEAIRRKGKVNRTDP